MTNIADFFDPHAGTCVSGRIQYQSPNILNITRDTQEAEYLWRKCRTEQGGNKFKLCNTCHERFRCWTASKPRLVAYIDKEFDFTQMHMRLYQVLTKTYTRDN